MSLIPPSPIVLSKLKYLVLNKFKDDPLLSTILERLGPFYEFKLACDFRNIVTGETLDLSEDISSLIESETTQWDCIDTALNCMTKLKTNIKELKKTAGFVRTYLKFGLLTNKDDKGEVKWFDLYLDEFPVNLVGLNTEKSE